MKTIRYHAATVRISWLPSSARGVVEARVSGPLSQAAFDALRPQVMDAIRPAAAVVVRFDTALGAITRTPDVGEQVNQWKGHPPIAYVTTAMQYELWRAYVFSLAKHGIRRAVFLASQLSLAYAWAESQALHHQRRSDPPESAPAPLAST